MKPLSILVAAIILSAVTSYGIVRTIVPANNSQTISTPKQSAYDRTIQSSTLKCGYIPYAPYFIKDANTGKLSGIFYDLTEKMASLLSLKVDWAYETTFATFIEDMKSGRYDVFCGGLWPNANRSRQIEYTHPANYVGLGVYVRADDNRFDQDYTQLNNKDFRFSTLDGEMSETVTKTDFPEAQVLSHTAGTDISQLVLDVSARKADAVIVETAVAKEFLKKNPGQLKNLTEQKPIRIFGNTWAVLKGEFVLTSLLNNVLDEMLYSGFVDATVKKYDAGLNSFYPVAAPYQTAK